MLLDTTQVLPLSSSLGHQYLPRTKTFEAFTEATVSTMYHVTLHDRHWQRVLRSMLMPRMYICQISTSILGTTYMRQCERDGTDQRVRQSLFLLMKGVSCVLHYLLIILRSVPMGEGDEEAQDPFITPSVPRRTS